MRAGAAAPRGDAAGTRPRAWGQGCPRLAGSIFQGSPLSLGTGQGAGLGSDSSQITQSRGPRGSPRESRVSHGVHRRSQGRHASNQRSYCPPQCRVTPVTLHSGPACVTSALQKQKMRVFSTPGAAPYRTGGKRFKQSMSKLR